MNLPPLDFTVLDTETTGFVPKVHRVIEFASIRVECGKIADEYKQLFDISELLPPVIRAITRIHDCDLKGKPLFEEKRDEILCHIGKDSIIVGQNVSFDIGILRGEGIDLSDHPWLDTSMLASLVFPELKSYALAYVSSVLNLNHEPVHRALGDVHATIELLSKCWGRLLELPKAELKIAKSIMARSSPAYQALFGILPSATAKKKPSWLESRISNLESWRTTAQDSGFQPSPRPTAASRARLSVAARPRLDGQPAGKIQDSPSAFSLQKPEIGVIDLIEEPPVSHVLQIIVDAASKDTGTVHWIAVKNLESAVQSLRLNPEVRVLYPPFLLADEKAVSALEQQSALTADEATLLLKMKWYPPDRAGRYGRGGSYVQSGLPVHGEEHAVWNGKLACTEKSERYIDQFKDLPTVVLLDHRQLLQVLADPEYAGRDALTEDTHIIIDDASMLEDTATKAYGWYCNFSDLRAAAKHDEMLMRLLDLAQLWIERVRNFQEIRYLTESDLTSSDARGLRERVGDRLRAGDLNEHAMRQLTYLLNILQKENLRDRITYIEHRMDGSQSVQSVPERVGTFLRDHLYGIYATSLLIPPGSAGHLQEVLPIGTQTKLNHTLLESRATGFAIGFQGGLELEKLLSEPPEGKTVILSPSKRSIDEAYIRYAEKLERKGITLICQGLSGGVNRSLATLLGADDPSILMVTPWAYEGIKLPPGTVATLCILALPFDHPSHAVLSRRAEHYTHPFGDYSLPRMKQRLFRILRTFSQHAAEGAEVLFLDHRIETKPYGKEVWGYVKQFSRSEVRNDDGGQMVMFYECSP